MIRTSDPFGEEGTDCGAAVLADGDEGLDDGTAGPGEEAGAPLDVPRGSPGFALVMEMASSLGKMMAFMRSPNGNASESWVSGVTSIRISPRSPRIT